VVLDAKQLLLDPPGVLRGACDRLGIPFHESMLRWPAGPKPEDGVWARHWYANVHASTGFSPYKPRTSDFPERLRPLLEESVPLYERLKRYAIQAA
jgi:sulfotransferase family protein